MNSGPTTNPYFSTPGLNPAFTQPQTPPSTTARSRAEHEARIIEIIFDLEYAFQRIERGAALIERACRARY